MTPEKVAKIRDAVRTALKNYEVVQVEFTKANGDRRVMNCTLHPNMIPESSQPKGASPVNEDVQRVFDADQNAWRSFRYDSVISWKFIPQDHR